MCIRDSLEYLHRLLGAGCHRYLVAVLAQYLFAEFSDIILVLHQQHFLPSPLKKLQVTRLRFADAALERLGGQEYIKSGTLTRITCLLYTSPSPRDRTR